MPRPLLTCSWFLAAAVLATGCSPSSTSNRTSQRLLPTGPLPPLQAEGWLLGAAPTSADLAGHVVVVQCWAYW